MSIDWRPIREHDGARIKALVFGIWDGEINSAQKDDAPGVYLCEWDGANWDVEGSDAYSARVLDVTHYCPVQPPSDFSSKGPKTVDPSDA